ncbi:hypothetical protein C1645_830408 [Glomus cerebriforme]|uniref:Uncharacterized protein n=1 Tax=Glomus cerebriforme TaxID=658196 RepID=A0A397SSN7_9GLOM|nr:hypothetical protein C1645_830408 [Glomus cerebriforme]
MSNNIYTKIYKLPFNNDKEKVDYLRGYVDEHQELKSEHGKDGSQALVKSEGRKAIPKAKCSDEALRKRMEYSGKIPEMWCSYVRYPFKKLLEYNPKYFSKNGFIQMIEKEYIDGEFKAGRSLFNIYYTVCDSVFIYENTIKCTNDHLNKCIARTAKKNLAYSIHKRKNVKKGEALI